MDSDKILTGGYKKAFLGVCVIGFILLLLLLIPISREKRQWVYLIEQTMQLSDDTTAVLYEKIALTPGIYSIRVDYQTAADFGYTVYLTDQGLSPMRVMQNPQNLAAAHTSETFQLWLLNRAENLTLFVDGSSGQEIYFDKVCITETNQVWYCLGLGILTLCALILAGIVCAARNHVKRIASSSYVTAGGVVLLTILLSIPYLAHGIRLTGDVVYHLERIDGVAQSITNGVFPMRLESNFPFGYGYADGVLYGSTLLYIPAVLWLAGFPVTYFYNLFLILVNLATIMVAFYCFYKMFQDKYIGLMCSALYAFSLYRITVLVGRGCVGEGCAQIFMPLLVYGYYRLFTEDTAQKRYRSIWLLLMIGYSGVLQSHTLSCELALIWTGVVCLANIRKVFRKRTLLELAKGAIASALCNAWYALPFLDYYLSEDFSIKNLGKQTIQYQGISVKHVFVHFFDGVLVDESGLPIRAVGPGLIPMLALFLFVGLWIYSLVKRKRSKLLASAGVCAVLSFACILFSMKIFPWDWIQQLNPVTERVVSSFLIPTRFLNWGTLFMVPAFGYCLWWAKCECRCRKLAYSAAVAAVVLTVGTSSIYYIVQLANIYEPVRIYDNNQVVGYVSGGEYIIYGTDTANLTYGEPETSETVQLLQYQKGDLAADFRSLNESETEEGYVEVPLFLYKGYHAYAGSGEELTCVYGENNVIRVLIPAGFDDTVTVRFESPVSWRISEAVSAAAWIGVVIYCVWMLRKKRNRAAA